MWQMQRQSLHSMAVARVVQGLPLKATNRQEKRQVLHHWTMVLSWKNWRPWQAAGSRSLEAKWRRQKMCLRRMAKDRIRYMLLAAIWILPLLLLTKPMGHLSLSLLLLSLLSLLEILDALDLRSSALGPILLALLGNYYFFKTGHSATLNSIQWDAAFIPLTSIHYPWSPFFVTLNTFAPLILCALAIPAIHLWKIPPRSTSPRSLLDAIARDIATFLLVYSALALATTAQASWLRRHLMLYRIFMPRMLMAIASFTVASGFAVFVGLIGVWWTVDSVAKVFGWAAAE